MDKPAPLSTKILTVLIGSALVAGFILVMAAIEKRAAVEIERQQLEVENRNLYFQKQSMIVITEVMTSNSLTIVDGFGVSSDWIELYNSGDESINLKDAGLSTNLDEPMMWVFPDLEIGPGEYRIVYASSLDQVDPAGNLHTNFRLNAELGETLYFTSALGTLIASIELPPLNADISYGMNENGEWLYFNHPTPGEMNGTDGQGTADFNQVIDSPLRITEYMIDNRSVLYDEDGDFSDWVEFYNDSDEPLSLAQLYFSDDPTDLRKWAFPDVAIAPRAYLVVFTSGKDKVTENVHTDFRLSAYETMVVSTRYAEVLAEVTVEPLLEDQSRGVQGGEWMYFSEPTPGAENSTHGFMEALDPSGKLWDVAINEVMARNDSLFPDALGNYYDWIELRNNTDRDIDLSGYSLGKGPGQEIRYVFRDTILPAHGYLVIFADAEVEGNGTDAYVPFSISASGETLFLCDAACTEVQIFETGLLEKNLSSGLNENGERVFFLDPTPGAANSGVSFSRYAEPVEFSLESGEIPGGQWLSLSAGDGATIFFTVDGSLPTSSDLPYTGPIALDSPRTVRAIAIVDGQVPSIVTTRTYIVGVEHDLPIVALSAEPDDLFGDGGIYTNPFNDLERPVHVEFFETDGLALSFDAGIEIAGNFSQAMPQKSLSIRLRSQYGVEQINYPFFAGNEVTSFSHLLLHTSGQDQNMTKIKDAFIHRAVSEVLDVDVMDARPCVVYINGEYWGLYDIREKINEDYFASHYGVDPDQMDVLIWNGTVLAGSDEAYRALIDYVTTHDLQNQEYYEYVTSQIDVGNYMDWLIVESYFGNTDLGNLEYWRDQNGGKWRWVLYDMDWSLFKGTYDWNNIEQVFNPDGMGAGNWIDTTLQVNLLRNEQFRQEFIRRYALYTNTFFNPKRLLPMYDAMIEEIRSEIPRNTARWPHDWGPWELHVGYVRQAIIDKPELEKKHLQDFFDLSDEEMLELFAP